MKIKFGTMGFNTSVYKAWVCIYMQDNQTEYREELGEGRQRPIL